MKKIIFCGRGPSTSMHIGHIINYQKIAKYGSENNLKILFQLSSDQKLHRDKKKIGFYKKQEKKDLRVLSNIFADNIKNNDILFFSSLTGLNYDLIFKRDIQRIKSNYFLPNFNITGHHDMLLAIYPYVQATIPILLKEWGVTQLLIFSGTDQNSYFDLAVKLDSSLKLTMIRSGILLDTKLETKMTSSNEESCIYITDSYSVIEKKLIASSSGSGSTKEHLSRGLLNPDADFSHHFLNLSGYDDELSKKYSVGEIGSKIMKKSLSLVIYKENLMLAKKPILKSRLIRFNQANIKKWIYL